MKEDIEIGIKTTENEDETMWQYQVDALKKEIDRLQKELKINKVFLEKSEEMLKNATKTEAKI